MEELTHVWISSVESSRDFIITLIYLMGECLLRLNCARDITSCRIRSNMISVWFLIRVSPCACILHCTRIYNPDQSFQVKPANSAEIHPSHGLKRHRNPLWLKDQVSDGENELLSDGGQQQRFDLARKPLVRERNRLSSHSGVKLSDPCRWETSANFSPFQ